MKPLEEKKDSLRVSSGKFLYLPKYSVLCLPYCTALGERCVQLKEGLKRGRDAMVVRVGL